MSDFYLDETYMPLWARAPLIGFFTWMGWMLGYQLLTGIGLGSNPAPNSVLFTLMLLFYVIYHTFHKLSIKVNCERIQLGYGFLVKNISLSDIVEVEKASIKFLEFGGLGLKYNLKGELAYSTRVGDAVRIIRKSGGPIIFTPHEPDLALKIIGKALSKV